MKYYFISLLLFFPSQFRDPASPKEMFIVWNVGQGLWSTLQSKDICYHVDFGGEKYSSKRIQNCFSNEIFLTHLDQDHISFLPRIKSKSCLHTIGSSLLKFYGKNKIHKLKKIQQLDLCDSKQSDIEKIFPLEDFNASPSFKDNDLSSVFKVRNQILIPGDSTLRSEKIWQTKKLSSIQILVLGHHGSQTSTGEELLRQLPNLRMAISSSRFAKYHHPSPRVVELLKQKKIPNLLTEDWGSIGIELRQF